MIWNTRERNVSIKSPKEYKKAHILPLHPIPPTFWVGDSPQQQTKNFTFQKYRHAQQTWVPEPGTAALTPGFPSLRGLSQRPAWILFSENGAGEEGGKEGKAEGREGGGKERLLMPIPCQRSKNQQSQLNTDGQHPKYSDFNYSCSDAMQLLLGFLRLKRTTWSLRHDSTSRRVS